MSAALRMRMRRRQRRQAGFNMVEVLVALAVLTLAVLGAAGLQTATTRANVTARNRTHATGILQTWVERVKMDAMAWQSGTTATPALFVGQSADAWFEPSDMTDGNGALLASEAAGFWGADLPSSSSAADIRYCVDLRYSQLSPGTLRADVRVWWHREGTGARMQGSFTGQYPDAGSQSFTGSLDTDRSRGCDLASDLVEKDPRINLVTASTTLVAL